MKQEIMSERELRLRMKIAEIRTLKKDIGKYEARLAKTGKEYFAIKSAMASRRIAELSYDLDYLRDIKLPA